jgi:hypothetical protein
MTGAFICTFREEIGFYMAAFAAKRGVRYVHLADGKDLSEIEKWIIMRYSSERARLHRGIFPVSSGRFVFERIFARAAFTAHADCCLML